MSTKENANSGDGTDNVNLASLQDSIPESRLDFASPVALLIITIIAWSIYAWVRWPHHWQSRLMHPVLFAPWTIAWHMTVRGKLALRLGFRFSILPTLLVPPGAALVGEAIQFVWKAVGHDPEWGGVGFSMLGVALGWGTLSLWAIFRKHAAGSSL